MKSRQSDSTATRVSIRVYDGKELVPPSAFIPTEGMNALWDGIGVQKNDWEAVQESRAKGTPRPLSSLFPELSKLSDMWIDNVIFQPEQIPSLISEVEIARQSKIAPEGLAVLDAIERTAKLARRENKGMLISPFG